MKNNDQLIDDIIAQLDGSFSKGIGHINLEVDEKSISLEKFSKTSENDIVKNVQTLECNPKANMACCVPTLMHGLDNDEKGE